MDAMAQKVILYTLDGETHVYDTGYSEAQVRQAVHNCVQQHGRSAQVRSLLAEHYPPQVKRP